MYHKWQSYDVWFLRHGAQQTEFFVILGHFLPFHPTQQKIKILKKWKKRLNMYKCTKNHDHMLYYTWDKHMTGVILIFHFVLFLPFYTSNSPTNQNFTKLKKAPGDNIILHICTKNYDHIMYGSWDMVCNRWTDRRTHGRTEKVAYTGGCPPKKWRGKFFNFSYKIATAF